MISFFSVESFFLGRHDETQLLCKRNSRDLAQQSSWSACCVMLFLIFFFSLAIDLSRATIQRRLQQMNLTVKELHLLSALKYVFLSSKV